MAQNVTSPPVPTSAPIVDPKTGLVPRVWIAFFQNIIKLIVSSVVSIQWNGVAVPSESSLNFVSPLTVTDNPANGSTDVGFAGFQVTTNANGTAILLGSVLLECGKSQAIAATGAAKVSVNVTFPVPFSALPVVVCNPDNTPDNTGNQPFLCYPPVATESGFTADFSCPILIGGSGASGIHNVIHCNWHAMGAA